MTTCTWYVFFPFKRLQKNLKYYETFSSSKTMAAAFVPDLSSNY
jgi:hypothetical protein